MEDVKRILQNTEPVEKFKKSYQALLDTIEGRFSILKQNDRRAQRGDEDYPNAKENLKNDIQLMGNDALKLVSELLKLQKEI